MRLPHSLSAMCLLAGCSLFQSTPASAPEAPPLTARVEREVTADEANLHVAEFVRNTPGIVQLSLWVDSGWMDTPNPDIAMASALYAARMTSASVSVRVTPNATSFETLCDTQETLACGIELLQRLAVRADDPSHWSRISSEMLTHLQASTPAAITDAEAVRQVYGSHGTESLSEPTPVNLESVRAFQESHYGPSRAALFLVGDVPDGLDRERLREIILQLPAATQTTPRPSRVEEPFIRSSVIEGSTPWLSLSAVAPSFSAAEETARFLRDAETYPGLQTTAFRLRNASIVRLSGPLESTSAEALWTRFALQMRREMSTAQFAGNAQVLSPPSILAFSQWQGEAWAHGRDPSGPPPPSGTMVAVNMAAGEGRRAARRMRQTRDAMQEVTSSLLNLDDLTLNSTEHDRLWSAQSDAGARLWFQKRSGAPYASVLIAFRGGAAADPPSEHGRAALFAYALAERCRQLAPSESEIRPVVSPTHAGILLSTRAEEHLVALRWAQRCAFDLDITGEALHRARIRLMQDQISAPRRFATAAARNLSPARPGIIAPLGAPGSLSSVRTDRLQSVANLNRVHSRLRVAIVGDFSREEVQSSLVPLLHGLPDDGDAPSITDWPRGSAETFFRDGHDLGGIVLTWRLGPTANGPARLVAQAFAERAARRTQQWSPVNVQWFGGGSWRGHAWAALALSGEPTELARVRNELSNLSEDAEEVSIADAHRAEALRMGSTQSAALALLHRDESANMPLPPEEPRPEPHVVFLAR